MALRGRSGGFFRGYGLVMSCIAGHGCGLHLFNKCDDAGEGLFACGFVGGASVGGFACAHEAVACSVVGDRFIFFACGFHGVGSGGDGGTDTGVVAGVEAVDRSGDGGYVSGAGAVEDEGGGEVFAVSGEGEGLAAAPAESSDGDLTVGCGNLFSIVGCGVKVGVDDGWVKAGDGFGGGVHAGEGIRAAAVGAETGEEVGCYDDEALSCEFVGHLFCPVAEAEDFVDENNDGGLGFDLGIDDEGLHDAVAVLEGDVLVVAGRGVEACFSPVLRMDGSGGERKEQSDGEKFEGAWHRYRHAGSLVPSV
jgi:hypothetical protein